MILQICVVRDSAANCYAAPMFVPSIGIAVRSFGDEVKRVDANNQLNKHPEDFEMFHLGTYDDNTATFAIGVMKSLARGVDYAPATV